MAYYPVSSLKYISSFQQQKKLFFDSALKRRNLCLKYPQFTVFNTGKQLCASPSDV